MNACSAEWNDMLSAWVDGETSRAEAVRVEAHLHSCARCAAMVTHLHAISRALRAAATVELPARVVERARGLVTPPSALKRRLGWSAIAAAAALLIFFGLLPADADAAFAGELSAVHFRAFTSASPCEFTSSDAAAVKAWLSEKVGYSVVVPVLPGAKLLGARRCRVAGTMTAALLYREGDKAITLFLPARDSRSARAAAELAGGSASCHKGRVGEEICVARANGTAYAAVSELEPAYLLSLLDTVAQSSLQ